MYLTESDRNEPVEEYRTNHINLLKVAQGHSQNKNAMKMEKYGRE